jgi:hypothetical protein
MCGKGSAIEMIRTYRTPDICHLVCGQCELWHPFAATHALNEHQESDEVSYARPIKSAEVDAKIIDAIPLLSDEGKALNSSGIGHRLKLGHLTFVAILARQSFLCGTEKEPHTLKRITRVDIDGACHSGTRVQGGISQLCRCCGFESDGNRSASELPEQPFLEQALWAAHNAARVAPSSNPSEVTHGRANEKAEG